MDYTIINKYLAGEASEAEVRDVFQWIDADPEHRKEFIQYKKVWALTASSPESPDKVWEPVHSHLAAPKTQVRNLTRYLSIAASVLVILGLGAVLEYFWSQSYSREPLYQADTRIEVPAGQMSKVVLPDGSVVHLNSGTKLVYSGGYISGQRTVTLDGEGFFKVAKDHEHPFVVQTKDLNFKVYGTSFNIQAYPEDKEINATLVEGSLGVIAGNGNELTRLIPGENAHFSEDKQKLTVGKVDLSLYTSWKDGLVTFRNEKLKDIAKKIERWYNVEIIITNPKLGDELYMGTIMKNKPIDQILEVFKLTSSMKYRIVPRADKTTLIYWE